MILWGLRETVNGSPRSIAPNIQRKKHGAQREAPNGTIVNVEPLRGQLKDRIRRADGGKVVDGVSSIGGYSLANTTVIEADDGPIVCDTGDTREEAEHIREAIESKISDKPIKVII